MYFVNIHLQYETSFTPSSFSPLKKKSLLNSLFTISLCQSLLYLYQSLMPVTILCPIPSNANATRNVALLSVPDLPQPVLLPVVLKPVINLHSVDVNMLPYLRGTIIKITCVNILPFVVSRRRTRNFLSRHNQRETLTAPLQRESYPLCFFIKPTSLNASII